MKDIDWFFLLNSNYSERQRREIMEQMDREMKIVVREHVDVMNLRLKYGEMEEKIRKEGKILSSLSLTIPTRIQGEMDYIAKLEKIADLADKSFNYSKSRRILYQDHGINSGEFTHWGFNLGNIERLRGISRERNPELNLLGIGYNPEEISFEFVYSDSVK